MGTEGGKMYPEIYRAIHASVWIYNFLQKTVIHKYKKKFSDRKC